MGSDRLLAVDPSLTCSGWALFSVGQQQLLGVGKVKSLAARFSLSERLMDIQSQVVTLMEELNIDRNDVLICESETTMRDPRAAIKVEQVRGIFETIARSLEARVPGRLNPRSVQTEIMGLRGRQLKRQAVKEIGLELVHSIYGKSLAALGFDNTRPNLGKNQDIVDAILLGHLAVSKVQHADKCGLALENVFATNRSKRRSSRFGWGKGETNSYGWSEKELFGLEGKK